MNYHIKTYIHNTIMLMIMPIKTYIHNIIIMSYYCHIMTLLQYQ